MRVDNIRTEQFGSFAAPKELKFESKVVQKWQKNITNIAI
jgi:hypothetical protein